MQVRDLSAKGASVVYVHPKDWKTVGIAGSTAALAAVSARSASNAEELIADLMAVRGGVRAATAAGAIVGIPAASGQIAQYLIVVSGAA